MGRKIEQTHKMENQAICLTFGEQSENHVGMKINGEGLANSGFSIEELEQIKTNLRVDSELYRLDEMVDEEGLEPASILIIRNGLEKLVGENPEKMMEEQLSFEWDKKYWDNRRSKVLNKHARYNVCFGEKSVEPKFEEKQGTIIGFDRVPILNKLKENLGEFFGDKARNLEVEGNLYYNVKKCGIGFHGDGERKRVIACSLGATRPIHWQWYHRSKPIGDRLKFEIGAGDIYIMSEKASGYDWKRRSLKTLRHAAGEKYVK